MLETVRSLAHTEAAREATTRNAKIEVMRRKQTKMEDELRKKSMEHEEAMHVTNERAHRFEQFLVFHMNQGFGGIDDDDDDDDDDEEDN
ncbi:unnamed protein product [Lathyrus oleraceus]